MSVEPAIRAPRHWGRVLTAMVTPFDAQGRLDLDAARRLARWLAERGNDGLVLAATTGEASTLSDAERCDLQAAGDMLTKAKQGLRLEAWEIDALAGLVNNSVVGASKLLHFVAPQTYAIWDSKVYAFVHERRPHHYRVNRRSDLRGLPQRAGHTGPASRVRALSRLDERKGRLPGIAAAGTRACHVPQRADLQRFHLSSGAPRRIDLQPPTTERVVRPC